MQQNLSEIFKKSVWEYYSENRREFPWRDTNDPYHILVSEFMLQQTQTDRVLPKYLEFLDKFQTLQDLSQARFSDVLRLWQGLGYNRRAKYLHETAKTIVDRYEGVVPESAEILITLPGIGPYASGAISTFAYNISNIFIETNIRTAYIHHFFDGDSDISDSDIISVMQTTLDNTNPREWYYALMDYGSMIKRQYGNRNIQSRTYAKQSKFEGSFRQKRGRVIQYLSEHPQTTIASLSKSLSISNKTCKHVLAALEKDGLVTRDGQAIYINDS